MRRILLAATAIAGLGVGSANVQAAEPGLTTDSFNAGLATGATLAPGAITVRLGAQMWVELSYGTDSGSKTATSKNSGVLLGSFIRLYPKFDAKAANGLEYGATGEIWMNSGGLSGSSGNTLFARRYNGYVGTASLGRFYFGPEKTAMGRLNAGTTMEDFDYNGGINGDVPSGLTGGNGGTVPNWFFARQSTIYTVNNLVYISPAFSGFTFGASWEPSSNSVGEPGVTAGTLGVNTASLANATASAKGRRNTFDIVGGYKGKIGPVSVKAALGYMGSGKVNDSTATATTATYKGWSFVDGGIRLAYGDLEIGGNALTGNYNANGNGSLLRKGQRNGTSFVVGVQYTIGPVIFGAQYINENTGGTYNPNPTYARSMLHETGIAIGGAYDYAPGASFYWGALYAQRHQGGISLLDGSISNSKIGNSVQGRGVQIGNTFSW